MLGVLEERFSQSSNDRAGRYTGESGAAQAMYESIWDWLRGQRTPAMPAQTLEVGRERGALLDPASSELERTAAAYWLAKHDQTQAPPREARAKSAAHICRHFSHTARASHPRLMPPASMDPLHAAANMA